jgi:nucleoside-diphosphate-sugar epimerase
MLMEITGRKIEIVSDEKRVRPENSEVNRLLADNKLIRDLTGWNSAVPFHDGLKKTVEWISKNLKYFNTDTYAR